MTRKHLPALVCGLLGAALAVAGASAQSRVVRQSDGTNAIVATKMPRDFGLMGPVRIGSAPAVPARWTPNRPCTEVRLRGLPPGAEVDAVIVLIFLRTQSIFADEDARLRECHARSLALGAAPVAPSLGEDSLERRISQQLFDLEEVEDSMTLTGLHPDAAHYRLTADQRGEARLAITRENLAPFNVVARGGAVSVLGVQVRAKDESGALTGEVRPFILTRNLMLNRDRFEAQMTSGSLEGRVTWTGPSGAPVRWNGRKFL